MITQKPSANITFCHTNLAKEAPPMTGVRTCSLVHVFAQLRQVVRLLTLRSPSPYRPAALSPLFLLPLCDSHPLFLLSLRYSPPLSLISSRQFPGPSVSRASLQRRKEWPRGTRNGRGSAGGAPWTRCRLIILAAAQYARSCLCLFSAVASSAS